MQPHQQLISSNAHFNSTQAHAAPLYPSQQHASAESAARNNNDGASQQQVATYDAKAGPDGDAQREFSNQNGLPGHVEGMTAEELVAAATRAAAASGYCNPQDLAAYVGTSLQVISLVTLTSLHNFG